MRLLSIDGLLMRRSSKAVVLHRGRPEFEEVSTMQIRVDLHLLPRDEVGYVDHQVNF